jgi:predicted extracellular nuclease
MIIRYGLFAFAFVLMHAALLAPAAAQACEPGKCIRVGAYNIQLFANAKGQADTDDELEELVSRIADEANLDVVVLVEINKNGELWSCKDGLRAKLRAKGYEVAIEGTFGGVEPDRQQFVILLYRTMSVSLVPGSIGEVGIPTTFDDGSCTYPNLRPPATARFKTLKGNFGFRVVGVHLKSESGEASCNSKIRTFQAQQIADFIAKLKAEKGEGNVMVVGDFNKAFGSNDFASLKSAGYETLISGNCSSANLTQCSYLGGPAPGLIDHVVVPSSMTAAVKGSGTIVKFGNLDTYLKTQSDHVPVWASFRID